MSTIIVPDAGNCRGKRLPMAKFVLAMSISLVLLKNDKTCKLGIMEPIHKTKDDAEIVCIERLGGLLKSYHRLAA